MKKTFLAMLLAGGTVSMYAQTTQSGTTTQGANSSTTNSSVGTTTNGGNTSSGTINNGASTTSGSMNNTGTTNTGTSNSGAAASTSWTPESNPNWGWNSYSIWYGGNNQSGNMNGTGNTTAQNNSNGTMDNSTAGNSSMGANGSLSSSSSYNAYGTAVPYLPQNVQMRFNQDFPAGVNNTYSWNQYGDWFHTYHMNNGRLTQYFYDQKGSGYALALPVIQTYVPENIINSALQKYGSGLYSIGMVKTNSGANAYQVGLMQNGQMNMQYLDDNGATVADVWRVENMNNEGSLLSTQSNAAMDASGNMSTDMNSQSAGAKKTKTKIEHADGTETKIKTKNGKTKVKTSPASGNMYNQQQ